MTIENTEQLPDEFAAESSPVPSPPRIWPTFVAPIAAVVLAVGLQAVVAVGLVIALCSLAVSSQRS